MDASDRKSCHSPLHFDLSTFDIYGTFATGAQLHLVPPAANLLPNKLAEFIRRAELTQWFSVPSALTYMAKFNALKAGDFPSLKRLLWCGEVFPTPALIYWMERLPHVRFTNLYGPTEATIASSYYTVPRPPQDPRARIPIGRACGGEELLVLDEHLHPVPAGQIADLYIAGQGLSPGYWQEPQKTAAAFLQMDGTPAKRVYRTGDLAFLGEDGLVYFVGRSDTQIKSRGHRIELGEIEAALNTLDYLSESAVVAIPTDGFEGTDICCAFAAVNDATPSKISEALRWLLPAYMLPSLWLQFEALPKNKNGKVDRSLLVERFKLLNCNADAAAAGDR
jgi:non-ribosomal peptide synthetase component F